MYLVHSFLAYFEKNPPISNNNDNKTSKQKC